MAKDRKQARRRVRYGIRKKISGTPDRPRVSVFRSLNHLYIQAIDDSTGATLAAASSRETEVVKKFKSRGNSKAAKEVGSLMARRLKDKGLKEIVFDRGGFVYHGRVKAAAEAMREVGIKF